MKTRRPRQAALDHARRGRVWAGFLVLLLLLSLATLGFYGYDHFRRDQKQRQEDIERDLAMVAKLDAERIERWRHERVADAALVRSTPYVARRALNFLREPEVETTRRMFTGWLDGLISAGRYERALLLDASLKTALVHPPEAPADLSEAVLSAARRAADSRSLVVIDAGRLSLGEAPHLCLLIPFVTRSAGDVPAAGLPPRGGDRCAAVLLLEANAERVLLPLAQGWPMEGSRGDVRLARQEGDKVVYLNGLASPAVASLALATPANHLDLVSAMVVIRETGTVVGTDHRGVPVVAAVQSVRDSPWFVVASKERQQVIVPLQVAFQALGGEWYGLGLAGCLTVALLWRWRREEHLRRELQSRQRLLESEQRWKGVLEDIPQIGISLDLQGRIVFANQHFLKLTGWTEAELLGRDWFDTFIPADRRTEVRRVFRSAVSQGRVGDDGSQHVNPILTRAGACLDVGWFNTVTCDGAGVPIEVTCLGVDLTENLRAQHALEESEARFRSIFETLTEGAVLHELIWDDHGRQPVDYRIVDVNPAFEKHTGLPASQAKGQLGSTFYNHTPAPYLDIYASVVQTGTPCSFETYFAPLRRHFAVSVCTPRPGWFATLFTDISGRKQAEEAIREHQRRLTTLMANLPGMAYRCANQPDWPMQFVSEGCASLTGWIAADLTANRPAYGELILAEDRQSVWDAVQAALKAHRPFECTYRIRRADGATRWVWERGCGVFDHDDALLFLEGFVTDVTERKRTEAAMRRRDAMLQAVGDASAQWLTQPDWQPTLPEVLGRLGRAADVSRAYVFVNGTASDGALLTSQSHEWAAEGITPQSDNPALQDFPIRAGGFGRWEKTLGGGGVIAGHVRDFPDSEQAVLAAQDIRSLVVVPVLVRGGWWGFLGFDECRRERVWSEPEIGALQTAARTLAAAIERQQSHQALEETRRLLERAQTVGRVGSWIAGCTPDSDITWSDEACDIFGLEPEEFDGRADTFLSLVHPEDRELVMRTSQDNVAADGHHQLEYRILRNGQTRWVRQQAALEHDDAGRPWRLVGMVQDITERRHAQNLTASRLRLLEQAEQLSLEELLRVTLDELEQLTDSRIGFYHFVEADQKTVSLQTWSTRTRRQFCQAEGEGLHYPVEEAGVWVDCIHQRQPVIHNDYASLPHRKGLPPGHAEVIREMVVPVFRGDRIVAVLGVGNKPSDYTEEDVRTVASLADLAWEMASRKRTESALRESEKHFADAFEFASTGMGLVSLDGRWLKVNRAACELTGYSPEELQSRTFQDLIHPDDREADLAGLQAMLKGERQTHAGEKRYLHKQGRVVWVLLNVSLLRDPEGRPVHFISQMQDITQRKEAEQALARERTLLRTLVDHLPLAVFVKDAQGRKLLANPCDVRTMGLASEAEALGKTDLDVFPSEVARRFMQDDEQVFRTGQPVLSREESLVRAPNSVLWNLTSKVPLIDEAGRTTGLVGISLDITARRRAEERLRESEERFTKAFQASAHVITINRLRDGAFVDVNEAFTASCGYTREEALASSSVGLALWANPEDRDRNLADLREHGSVLGREYQFRTKDGRILTALYSAHTVQLGGETCVLTNLNDITARKQAEESLRHLLEERTALLREVHHRVKNNLQIVSSLLNLQASQTAQPDVLNALQETGSRVRAMALLHETLYRSSSLARVDLRAYLERICTQLTRSSNPHVMARIQLRLDLEPLELSLDQAVPCGLLVHELMANALKHAFPDGRRGTVTLSLRPPDATTNSRTVEIEVRDDGIGLVEDFDPAKAHTLGLRLVSSLVSQLRGRLEIRRQPQTTFHITFAPDA